MENEKRISCKCLFCDCILVGDVEKEYVSGDMIKCQECGELNDYDSVIGITINEYIQSENKILNEKVKNLSKNLFKK